MLKKSLLYFKKAPLPKSFKESLLSVWFPDTNYESLIPDPTLMYSTAGEETSGLESSFTSPSVHKDMIEQYLNKMGTSGVGGAGTGGLGDLTGTSTADPLANLYG